jgi:hypothetical protein
MLEGLLDKNIDALLQINPRLKGSRTNAIDSYSSTFKKKRK